MPYLAPGENRRSARRGKGMAAKDHVTAYLCTNATGRKVPLSLIGTSSEPRCFRIRKSPVEYFSQKNAWSDARVFQQWWSKVFLPHVRSVTSKKVVLNHSSHANLVDPRKQVTILELPPTCTSKHQPMDAGIIAAWKVRYKTKLLAIRVNSMSSAAQLRQQAKQRKVVRGCMGLAEGAHPHILDAAELGCAAWNEMSEETIKRCWKKADILPPTVHADIDQTAGKTATHESFEDLAGLLKRMSMEAKNGNSVDTDLSEALQGVGLEPGAEPAQVSMDAVEAWWGIEEDGEVTEALAADAKEDLLEGGLARLNMDSEDKGEQNSSGG